MRVGDDMGLLLLAAIPSPTDAALGQPVVSNPTVPERARRPLIVESGLNDGLALPLILLLASIAATMETPAGLHWLGFGAKQLILGPLVGAVFGWPGGRALIWASDANATSAACEGIGSVAPAGAAHLAAEKRGGSSEWR
jgi:NhaP-type Na+/H+ or K+/H+ antiporter